MCNLKSNPGKFEGESCITYLAYGWMLNSLQDDTEYSDDDNLLYDNPVEVFNGPFNLSHEESGILCIECANDILQAEHIKFWQDDQGFAYSEFSVRS